MADKLEVDLSTFYATYTRQHIEPHCCNALQHTATHCSTLQHTATHCNTHLGHNNSRQTGGRPFNILRHLHTATYCNTLLQRTATLYSTLQHTATHCNTHLGQNNGRQTGGRPINILRHLRHLHTATYCNTPLQHTATLHNTLQHTATHCNTHLGQNNGRQTGGRPFNILRHLHTQSRTRR